MEILHFLKILPLVLQILATGGKIFPSNLKFSPPEVKILPPEVKKTRCSRDIEQVMQAHMKYLQIVVSPVPF